MIYPPGMGIFLGIISRNPNPGAQIPFGGVSPAQLLLRQLHSKHGLKLLDFIPQNVNKKWDIFHHLPVGKR